MTAVFISATSKDLGGYVQAVEKSLRDAGYHVVTMSNFGAQPDEPRNSSLQEIEKVDYFVGLYARRYGYIPEGETLSITEQEYHHARLKKIPIFAFRVDDANTDLAPGPGEDDGSDSAREKQAKLKSLLTHIETTLVRETFVGIEDLKAKVLASISRYEKRKPSLSLDQRNRIDIIKRIRIDWINGYLKDSLDKVPRIELGLEVRSDAVEQPWKDIVQQPDTFPKALPLNTNISQIFDDQGGALLILGAPGTGKTTLILELARDLLDRAEKDGSYPIPVVFHLSYWAVRRQSLDKWLVVELNERSDVPKRIGQKLVDAEQILPLLDGLDEVAQDHREACVEAINNFRRGHGLLPIVVCSRIRDYEDLGTKLRLRSAVVVQPLTPHQVEDYLDRIGDPVKTHCTALCQDSSLGKLLETPLMLWVATLAYRDAPAEFAQQDTIDQRHGQLFANFVDAMFKRRSVETRYTRTQTIFWLSWLASTLTRNNQAVFHLEDLQVGWLPTRTRKERWLLTLGVAVANGLAAGLIFGLAIGLIFVLWTLTLRPSEALSLGLYYGLHFVLPGGLIAGLLVGLSAALVELRPVETMRFTLADMRSRIPKAMRYGLLGGLSGGLLGGLSDGLSSGLSSGLIFGLIVGLFVALLGGLINLLYAESVETRISPNQGTRRSLLMALSAFLIFGLTVGLIILLTSVIRNEILYNVFIWISIYIGLFAGMIGWLIDGGLFFLSHFVIRLALRISGLAPFNYVRFLNYATDRLFLYRVGGGYIFVHRLLREYFSSLAAKGHR